MTEEQEEEIRWLIDGVIKEKQLINGNQVLVMMIIMVVSMVIVLYLL